MIEYRSSILLFLQFQRFLYIEFALLNVPEEICLLEPKIRVICCIQQQCLVRFATLESDRSPVGRNGKRGASRRRLGCIQNVTISAIVLQEAKIISEGNDRPSMIRRVESATPYCCSSSRLLCQANILHSLLPVPLGPHGPTQAIIPWARPSPEDTEGKINC